MASLPVTGGTGLTPAALSAAIAAPPVPSLAATTPTIFFPKRVIWPLAHCCAFGGAQSGVSYSASVLYPLPARPSWMPSLISPAAASVGEPLISSTPTSLVGTLVVFRCSTSDLAIALPIALLSKDT